MKNEYIPFLSEIVEVIKHTEIEYTFRMRYTGDVKPGQFFEVSLPKFGEAPISVSGIGEDTVDLTIRKVGKVTGEIFKNYVGSKLFLRGPTAMVLILMNTAARISSWSRAVLAFHQYAVWSIILPHTLRKPPL